MVQLDDAAVRRTTRVAQATRFADVFGKGSPVGTVIGSGDALDIAVWEAPPAVLFGATNLGSSSTVTQSAAIPQQVVGEEGTVSIPFVGQLPVIGLTPQQVERAIVSRLKGRAHDPQAVVRLVQNEARTATVMGEVGASRRIPLTARGERLLDALASAGGARQPVGKVTIQLSRGMRTTAMPLEAVIRDPSQNIILQPDDVLTVMFQPYSFIALGAVGQNAEVPFEGGGLSLAQALGRIGGLRDERANVRGVFVFRLEAPDALDSTSIADARRTADDRIPVIYRLDMSDASSLFLAQDFVVHDRDVIYVSNAPGADLQKFINSVSSAAFSIIAVGNSVK
ncbi:polysaccharide biosynthesis/export family protein [Novosphingobium guangzhouense]|uniref:polysaccharide biosynthesis/export family protein n=1 Tax=Novosphingobium guangzhouense TaxID=1850347 RepID=UPI001FEB1EC3|nr:polysaccharide biosynthesis/export family protein [Novosphingobium guangzhouense]